MFDQSATKHENDFVFTQQKKIVTVKISSRVYRKILNVSFAYTSIVYIYNIQYIYNRVDNIVYMYIKYIYKCVYKLYIQKCG